MVMAILTIFPVILQTVINLRMLSIGAQGLPAPKQQCPNVPVPKRWAQMSCSVMCKHAKNMRPDLDH